MKLSYHSWKNYTECPKRFLLQNIQKRSPTVMVNDYHTLYGKLIQKFFELYSNIWKHKTPHLFPEHIREKLLPLYEAILNTTTVIWNGPGMTLSKSDIFDQACNDIGIIMESDSLNKFLNTKSEVSIKIDLKDSNTLEGRIDFIYNNSLSDMNVIIFDGKGTNKIGKNISQNQLYFYALLYYLHNKTMPTELGFFYFRHNTYIPVPFNFDILNEFRAKLSLDIKAISNGGEFKATPSAKSCKYCPYNNTCTEGLLSKAQRARPSKIKDLEGGGVIEFGL